MKNNIIELRKKVPIPLKEAKELLEENDQDIEKCIYLFKAKSIKQICDETQSDEKTASHHYETEKLDINRAISSIKEEQYDHNYQIIEGISKQTLRKILEWISIIENKDFGVSLDYTELKSVIDTLYLLPDLREITSLLEKVQSSKNEIFDGYTDTMPIEEFVKRHAKLDDDPYFKNANTNILLRLTIIKQQLLRHLRNAPE